jgi:hypothetical protein
MDKSIEVYKPKQGLIPAIKSAIWGDPPINQDGYGGIVTQSFWQRIGGGHSFNKVGLKYLVKTGFERNPVGFGAITKIILAQRNITFEPYWKGKPYVSKKIEYDINYGLYNLITTGTCIIYEKEVVGFGSEFEVLDTLRMGEDKIGKKFYYEYDQCDGTILKIPEEKLIFITIFSHKKGITQFGLSPLQAAQMPIESLKEMYTADTSMLKNKGVDVLITNDTDEPIVEDEHETMDAILNKRISGARKAGGVATSTSKLRVMNLGRTVKELALWDGYKIKARDLCNVLQIDSGLLNDPDNKTYANREEAEKSLYTSCVIPFSKVITDNKELVKRQGFEVYCNTSNIECLQISFQTKAEKANTIKDAVVDINTEVNKGNITHAIGVLLLMEFGYDAQEAELYVVPDPIEPEETLPTDNQNLEST